MAQKEDKTVKEAEEGQAKGFRVSAEPREMASCENRNVGILIKIKYSTKN